MAKKTVMAYYMHEDELLAAEELIEVAETTDSFVLGEIDADDIPHLQEKGLIVQEMIPPGEVETPGVADALRSKGLVTETAEMRSAGLEADTDFTGSIWDFQDREEVSGPGYCLLQLKGPLMESWREQLEALGVELLERVPPNSYSVRLPLEKLDQVDALPFVTRARRYRTEDTLPTSLSEMTKAIPRPGEARAIKTYDLRLHRQEDLPEVIAWLEQNNVSTAGSAGRKVRVYLLEGSPLAEEIAGLEQVAAIEEHIPIELYNDVARRLMGVDPNPDQGNVHGLPWTGEGQIVGVADTGLDDTHPDFQGRVIGPVPLGQPNDARDFNGHGTHVAGSIAGDGSASDGKICGVAPQAKIFFQALMDAQGRLSGLPLDLNVLFEEAYQAGARIHNNSWGANTKSAYTFNSIEVDEFIASHRDMLIVISAGNEGSAFQPRKAQPGFVDWLSIGSPASSKNALTVGASRSTRNQGGFSTLTYGQAWPAAFPDPPIADSLVSGNAECIAGFSSRGPCDDRRIKPDLVAPGTDIVSTKSTTAPLRNFWGAYTGNPHYAYMGGTSMAAPLVAGCAALVREYYVKERDHQPSAALLKATLINGTRWLTGDDAVADFPNLPNFNQGFGSVYLPWTLPNSDLPKMKLEFVDAWQGDEMLLNRTGQRFRFRFTLDGGKWLRFCLAFTDLPARALQNNLNLIVEHESRQKWLGNADLPMSLTIPDPDNNIEVVRIENPPAGDYIVQVSAGNILQRGQDFALVVTGELGSELKQI